MMNRTTQAGGPVESIDLHEATNQAQNHGALRHCVVCGLLAPGGFVCSQTLFFSKSLGSHHREDSLLYAGPVYENVEVDDMTAFNKRIWLPP